MTTMTTHLLTIFNYYFIIILYATKIDFFYTIITIIIIHLMSCPVCFENIGVTNNCITPCGHTFCLICMLKCIRKNNTCPCCRTIIIEEEIQEEIQEEEDEDVFFNEDDSDDSTVYETDITPEDYNTELESYDSSDDESNKDMMLVSLDKIADVLKERGYTILDILHCIEVNTLNSNRRLEISSIPSLTQKQFLNIIYRLDEELLNEELIRELNEKKLMMENDNKPQISLLYDHVSLNKIADELEKREYTLLDILHCCNSKSLTSRKYSLISSSNTIFNLYDIIDELDEERINENNEILTMMNNDIPA